MQEALHNIAKYSQAEFVELSLRKRDATLELTIKDNGEGFDGQGTIIRTSWDLAARPETAPSLR